MSTGRFPCGRCTSCSCAAAWRRSDGSEVPLKTEALAEVRRSHPRRRTSRTRSWTDRPPTCRPSQAGNTFSRSGSSTPSTSVASCPWPSTPRGGRPRRTCLHLWTTRPRATFRGSASSWTSSPRRPGSAPATSPQPRARAAAGRRPPPTRPRPPTTASLRSSRRRRRACGTPSSRRRRRRRRRSASPPSPRPRTRSARRRRRPCGCRRASCQTSRRRRSPRRSPQRRRRSGSGPRR
mmetsp:Transcript_58558/g.164241  ORF Transcript_58558/g.164241 Transcript_58558/m.164241 type:complete len:236 (+) Transcript_58558:1135-1842(+)